MKLARRYQDSPSPPGSRQTKRLGPSRREFMLLFFKSDPVTDCLIHTIGTHTLRANRSFASNEDLRFECDSKPSISNHGQRDSASDTVSYNLNGSELLFLHLFRQTMPESGNISRLDRWRRDPTIAIYLLIYYNCLPSFGEGALPPGNISTLPRNLKTGGDVPRRDNTPMVDILHVA
jgi:hypothetical protein